MHTADSSRKLALEVFVLCMLLPRLTATATHSESVTPGKHNTKPIFSYSLSTSNQFLLKVSIIITTGLESGITVTSYHHSLVNIAAKQEATKRFHCADSPQSTCHLRMKNIGLVISIGQCLLVSIGLLEYWQKPISV